MSIKLEKNGYIKTIPTATVNAHTRLSASCRRFKFEFIKFIGVLRFIDKINGLTIKEPYNKLYKRSLM